MNRDIYNALRGVNLQRAPIPAIRFVPGREPGYLGTRSDARFLTAASARRARSRNTHPGKRGKKVSL